MTAPGKPPRVFLSYSHDSPAHSQAVLDLADRLRRNGVDAWLDRYETMPDAGWERWMVDEIQRADFVLLICTETYRRRFEGHEVPGSGLGVDWEGAIIVKELYGARLKTRKFLPVLLRDADRAHLPTIFGQGSHRVVLEHPEGYEELLRLLTGQPATPARPLGPRINLPEQQARSSFPGIADPPTSPDFESYRAWSSERWHHLELIGLGANDVRLKLDDVYVPLRFLGRGERPEEGTSPLDHRLHHADEDVEIERIFSVVPRHAVLLGEPGTGKTTALKKLHQLCWERGSAELGLPEGYLPCFLRLRRLKPETPDLDLQEFIRAELDELSNAKIGADQAKALWQHGRILLLCDALDEVAKSEERSKVWRLLTRALRTHPHLRAIVSCRETGWSSDFPLDDGFSLLGVKKLTDHQIEQLVRKWFDEAPKAFSSMPAAEADAAHDRLIQALRSKEYSGQRLKVLVSTPLLLTLLCIVVFRGHEIPRQRSRFYEECVRILLGKWRAQADRKPPLEVDQALPLVAALAFLLHRQHRRDDLTLLEAVELFCRTRERSLAFAFFRWLHEDAGLLERITTHHYGFVHLGLQEYLTACHLEQNPAELGAICTEHQDSWWLEVFLVLASLGQRTFADLCRGLLSSSAALENASLLGQILQEAGLGDAEPFVEVLGGRDAARQQVVLRLLEGQRHAKLQSAVEELAARTKDETTRRAAGAWLDRALQPAEARRDQVFLAHNEADAKAVGRLRKVLQDRAIRVYRPQADPFADASELEHIAATCHAIVWVAGRDQNVRPGVELLWSIAGDATAMIVVLPGCPEPKTEPALIKDRLQSLDRADALVAALLAIDFPAAPAAREIPSKGPVMGESFVEPTTDEIFLWVPPGRFAMGEPGKAIEVTLSGYWLARTPVTTRQYALYRAREPGPEPPRWRDKRFSAPEMPVVGVTWHEAMDYCRWLATKCGLATQLPSEAQWEYAARGPQSRPYPWGNDPPWPKLAIFGRNWQREGPAEVGSCPAGAGPFGHLDLAGNVWEWCRDLWAEDYRQAIGRPATDPVVTSSADSLRPLRGGGWLLPPRDLLSAIRHGSEPVFRNIVIGFRVAVSPANLGS